jgi:hypothetical protein
MAHGAHNSVLMNKREREVILIDICSDLSSHAKFTKKIAIFLHLSLNSHCNRIKMVYDVPCHVATLGFILMPLHAN